MDDQAVFRLLGFAQKPGRAVAPKTPIPKSGMPNQKRWRFLARFEDG
jgi:hypothetical protein